jgi:hypothetical protein
LNTKSNRSIVCFLSFVCVLISASAAAAQKNKPWTEWTKKEAEKILADSPWSQTQTETDLSEMFYSPTSDPARPGVRTTSTTASRQAEGATNQEVNVKYHIRFFSARPVRQALARLIVLNSNSDPRVVDRVRNFAEVEAADSVIVTVSYESTDQRFGNKAMQAFNSAVTSVLKNSTYLEVKGERLYIEEYIPPGKDGFGARFIFLRRLDGRTFITPDSGEVRFVTELDPKIKLNMRFRVAEMIYNGKFEY